VSGSVEPAGLTGAEAQRRLAEHGPNVLAEPDRPSHVRQLLANLVHLFALLRPGDRISADGAIVSRVELRVDNSTLTGESWPVEPRERVFAGTWVAAGAGEAVVTATGMATEFGRIAALAQATGRDWSPLELELDHLTRFVAVIVVASGTAFFFLAGALGMGLQERFVFAIGVMVANVPEGLLPTVTLSLALATQRMARRNALVRRLSSVETLGETTVICTDKTGTLTRNEMTVQWVWTPQGSAEIEGVGYEPHGRFRSGGDVIGPAPFHGLLRAALLCNDSRLVPGEAGWAVAGDPTEGALVVAAAKAGLDHAQERARLPRLAELPFDSARMRMSTIHLAAGARLAFVKGAPERVLERTALPEPERQAALAVAEAMEVDGHRVLAVAQRTLPEGCEPTADAVERELELLGFVGIVDPPRTEVAGALEPPVGGHPHSGHQVPACSRARRPPDRHRSSRIVRMRARSWHTRSGRRSTSAQSSSGLPAAGSRSPQSSRARSASRSSLSRSGK